MKISYLYHLKYMQKQNAFFKRTNSCEGKHSIKYQERFPNCLGAKLLCIDDRFTLPVISFKGDDCVNKLIKWIFRQQKQINRVIKEYFNKDLVMAIQDEEIYNNSQICWICNEELNTGKVRGHCHITGKFREAAHNQYNVKLKISKNLPIIAHHLERYDGNIIFKELNSFDVTIGVIPKTIEKYMSIIVNRNVTFIDSNEFFKVALDTLLSNLEDNDSKYLISGFLIDKLEILKRKDAYPQEWVDLYERFNYPLLPLKEWFYSSSRDGKRDKSDGNDSDEQYLHLKNVWDTFNFNLLQDFQNHYLIKRCIIISRSL